MPILSSTVRNRFFMAASSTTTAQTSRHTALPGMPRKPLDATKQLEAIRRVQSQAENRIKLGLQLFKAAEGHTSRRRDILEDIKTDQKNIRDQLQSEMVENFQRYEHRIDSFDDKVTRTIESLDKRIGQLQEEFAAAETRIQTLLQRAEQLLDSPAPSVSPPDAIPVISSTDSPSSQVSDSPPPSDQLIEDPQIFTRVIHRLDEQKPGSPIPPQPTN